jgi:limonene-1,2-epoxide hydrolase
MMTFNGYKKTAGLRLPEKMVFHMNKVKTITMKPRKIIEDWVAAFNNGNADAIADFYSENAVNHQVAELPVTGKEAIRQMFANEFSRAEMTCLVENIFSDGEWVALEWKDPLGLRGCGFFQVQNGKIVLQRGYWDKLSFLKQHNLPIPG